MAVGSPTSGPNNIVYNNILYRHYGNAATEISFLDSLALPVKILRPAYPCPVLSKQRQGVACGVACSVAERAV